MQASSDDRKPTSWTARVLAPIVLVVVVAAIILVVTGSQSSDDGSKGSSKQTSSSATGGCHPDADQAVKDGYYVVQADDIEGLSGIAAKTCVPLEHLVELNPNLDPQALQVNNCVDLVVDGCKALAGG